jgi:hypothetical protein
MSFRGLLVVFGVGCLLSLGCQKPGLLSASSGPCGGLVTKWSGATTATAKKAGRDKALGCLKRQPNPDETAIGMIKGSEMESLWLEIDAAAETNTAELPKLLEQWAASPQATPRQLTTSMALQSLVAEPAFWSVVGKMLIEQGEQRKITDADVISVMATIAEKTGIKLTDLSLALADAERARGGFVSLKGVVRKAKYDADTKRTVFLLEEFTSQEVVTDKKLVHIGLGWDVRTSYQEEYKPTGRLFGVALPGREWADRKALSVGGKLDGATKVGADDVVVVKPLIAAGVEPRTRQHSAVNSP